MSRTAAPKANSTVAEGEGTSVSRPYHPAMLAKFTGWVLLGLIRLLTGALARWWGCPPKAEQRICFANHQSHLDLVMTWAALPEELRSITRPIAARDYWATTPFKRWITTEVFNAIYAERGGSAPGPLSKPGSAEALAPLQPLVSALHKRRFAARQPAVSDRHIPATSESA